MLTFAVASAAQNQLTMGLYHFNWNGKERSVSIRKDSGKIILRFIDEEIINLGLEKISFPKGEAIERLANHYAEKQREALQLILSALSERTGFAIFN